MATTSMPRNAKGVRASQSRADRLNPLPGLIFAVLADLLAGWTRFV
jgi:hypothetical protein